MPAARLTMAAVVPRLASTVIWSTALYAVYTYLGEGLASLSYSTEDIASVIAFYGLRAICGVIVGGRLADRIGAGLTSAVALVSLCWCLLLLRLALDVGALVGLAFGLLSFAAQLFFPAQQIRLAQAFAAGRATILAWNNSALFLGISLGSLIGGQAMSLGGLDLNLLIAGAIAIVGGAVNEASRQTQVAVSITRRPSQPQGAG